MRRIFTAGPGATAACGRPRPRRPPSEDRRKEHGRVRLVRRAAGRHRARRRHVRSPFLGPERLRRPAQTSPTSWPRRESAPTLGIDPERLAVRCVSEGGPSRGSAAQRPGWLRAMVATSRSSTCISCRPAPTALVRTCADLLCRRRAGGRCDGSAAHPRRTRRARRSVEQQGGDRFVQAAMAKEPPRSARSSGSSARVRHPGQRRAFEGIIRCTLFFLEEQLGVDEAAGRVGV